MSRSTRRPSLHHGFTLIEMIVVIGIIVMLIGLTVAVGTAVRRRAETRNTENTLRLMDMATEEWSRLSEREISYGMPGVPAGPPGSPSAFYEINETTYGPTGTPANQAKLQGIVLGILMKNPDVAKIMAQINPKYLVRAMAQLDSRLLDPWDQKIQVVFPGRLWVVGDTLARDEDGTVRTTQENIYGVCSKRRIAFVSFGPDGQAGNLQLNIANPTSRNQANVALANDNLYSYPLLKENPS